MRYRLRVHQCGACLREYGRLGSGAAAAALGRRATCPALRCAPAAHSLAHCVAAGGCGCSMRGGWRTVRSRSSTRRAASATRSTGGDRRKALGAFARSQRQSVAHDAWRMRHCNVWRCDVRRGGMLQRARDAVRLTVRRGQRMRRNARDGCGLAWLPRGDCMVAAWLLRGFRSPTQRCGGWRLAGMTRACARRGPSLRRST